jgi:hypothetical protein
MDLSKLREAYIGKRVELPGRGVLACLYCGSHLICYNVVPYSRMDGKGREAQIQEIPGICLRCSDARCGYTSVLPLTVKAASAVKLHPALPEQLEAVRAWLAT